MLETSEVTTIRNHLEQEYRTAHHELQTMQENEQYDFIRACFASKEPHYLQLVALLGREAAVLVMSDSWMNAGRINR